MLDEAINGARIGPPCGEPDIDGDGSALQCLLEFGPFRLAASERLLLKNDTEINIGGRAFDLLMALTHRAGEVISARELMQLVWPDVFVEEANLRVCVAALRKALGHRQNGPRYIVTIVGRGYAFVAPVRHIGTADPVRRPGAEPDGGNLLHSDVLAAPGLSEAFDDTLYPSGSQGSDSSAKPSYRTGPQGITVANSLAVISYRWQGAMLAPRRARGM